MQTFLLTYNPDSEEWRDQEGKNCLRKEVDDAQKGRIVRWNCAKDVKKGNRGFLLWLGDPNVAGIFGIAEAVCDAIPDNGKGHKRRHFACWKVARIVHPKEDDPIIPIGELENRFSTKEWPSQKWHPQKSDARTLVPESVADTLVDEILTRPSAQQEDAEKFRW